MSTSPGLPEWQFRAGQLARAIGIWSAWDDGMTAGTRAEASSHRAGTRTLPWPLADTRAAALHEQAEHHDEKRASGNPDQSGGIHGFLLSFYLLKNSLNCSEITMIAGPRVTRNKVGKIKKTRGKISLTVVFAACSSICCTRCVRIVSECVRRVFAMLVPNCSDCTSVDTRLRTTSTSVRSDMFRQASARGRPARCSRTT